ncbi:MAG: DUF4288 domain-containing protein [Chitinophagales bacterium]|nr:DUF4288 domain-containing protein [Chitinophagales bacterium]
MKWYLAKIIFQIICGEGKHRPQFDEQLRLIKADSQQQAYEKAKALGEQEQEIFYNKQKKPVQWKFIDAPEIYLMDQLVDGAEMYSRIQEPEQPENYKALIRKKASQFQPEHLSEFLQPLRDAVLLF